MERGRYIVLEGGSGSGKSTQAEKLIAKLEEIGLPAVYLPEPGGTVFAQNLNELIRKKIDRTPKANVLAFNAARAEAMNEVEEALSGGKWLVADRSFLSTIIYQGYGEGQDIEEIRKICDFAMGDVRPDIVIVLDIDAETAANRMESAQDIDYFQDMNSQFQDRVREGYRAESKLNNYHLIDGKQKKDVIAASIFELIKDLPSGGTKKSKQPATSAHEDGVVRELSDYAISQLLTKNTWHSHGSSKIIDYSVKLDGRYRFYIPNGLDEQTLEDYVKAKTTLFETYSRMVHVLSNFLAQNSGSLDQKDDSDRQIYRIQALKIAESILPISATKRMKIDDPTRQRLESQELPRLINAEVDLRPVKKDSMNVDDTELEEIIDELSPYSADFSSSKLIDVSIRNDLDLVPLMLFEHSSLSLEEIKGEFEKWPIGEKIAAFDKFLSQSPDQAKLPQAAMSDLTYTFEILAEYGSIRSLQSHSIFNVRQWQPLTPRFGFNIEKIIEDADLSQQFESSFDISVVLYNTLVERNYVEEAQYALLFGHKSRVQLKLSCMGLAQLAKTGFANPIIDDLLSRIAEVHPNLMRVLGFK